MTTSVFQRLSLGGCVRRASAAALVAIVAFANGPSGSTFSVAEAAETVFVPVIAGRVSSVSQPSNSTEWLVGVDLSNGEGTYTEQLLLDGKRSVALSTGEERRVESLVRGQELQMERGLRGLVTEARPLPASGDARTAPRALNSRRVVATIFHLATELVTIRTADSSVVTTPDHPFMKSGAGWTNAGDLALGDRIVTAGASEPVTVTGIEPRSTNPTPVYNLSVEGSHTYYVGPEALLVHNADNGCDTQTTTPNQNPAQQAGFDPPGRLHSGQLEQAQNRINDAFTDGRITGFTEDDWKVIQEELETLRPPKPRPRQGKFKGNEVVAGGGQYANRPPLLPEQYGKVGPITYYEYDVEYRPKGAGLDRERGAKRLIIGSDGSAYVTANHYHGFVPIKSPSGGRGTRQQWAKAFGAIEQDYTYHAPVATNQR